MFGLLFEGNEVCYMDYAAQFDRAILFLVIVAMFYSVTRWLRSYEHPKTDAVKWDSTFLSVMCEKGP